VVIKAPAHWDKQLTRACSVCDHGRTEAGDIARRVRQEATHCSCQAVAGQQRIVPVVPARNNNGPCGPEAHHLRFPGLTF
jgi:hypothetical protein